MGKTDTLQSYRAARTTKVGTPSAKEGLTQAYFIRFILYITRVKDLNWLRAF